MRLTAAGAPATRGLAASTSGRRCGVPTPAPRARRLPPPPSAATSGWASPPAWWGDDDREGEGRHRPRWADDGGELVDDDDDASASASVPGAPWDPLGLFIPTSLASRSTLPVGKTTGRGSGGGSAGGPSGGGGGGGDLGDALATSLPLKLAALVGLVALSRVGVFLRLPGVDADAFASSLASGGLLGYIDTLSGGSISRVGVFSLGIVPYINASIVLQLMSTAFPSLKKLQREEGPQGRVRFQFYQKCLALVFAVVQAFGQLSYVRPFVPDWSTEWLGSGVLSLTAGAMVLIWIADLISELKVGNGTSILITANIASSLPTSVGAALAQAGAEGGGGPAALGAYALAFIATTLGVVYVQEAERQIPINYASRYRARSASLQRAAYLPFKVNATGVMPVIFASTLLSLPAGLSRYAPSFEGVAKAVGPAGPLYLPVSVALIVFFNYYYTFLQLEPDDLAEQLKRQGASIPAVRPGRATAEYVTRTLTRMSVLGSAFLGALAAAPPATEALTGLTAFRGFAGTSLLILVGVATDTARKIKAEQAMAKYQDIDKLYDDLDKREF